MRRVSAAHPCPVCKKPDWCLVAPDRTAAICARAESPHRSGDAGWLHRLVEPTSRPGFRQPKAGRPAPTEWLALARRRAADLTTTRREELARGLGLSTEAVDALPLLGFHNDSNGAYFVFPETDAAGTVIGLNRRFLDGRKRMQSGGKRGLTLPTGWPERPGPAFVVEGPTDAASMIPNRVDG